MAEKPNGIDAWMASIRTSMANDPCRQLFEDQVQTHAFIFLDDYLENILAGPKQGPIIELVKTPGRKKNLPRRTRAATAAAAKAQNIVSLSLDDDCTTKEDVPVNSFHKALLQAKEKVTQEASDHQKAPLVVSLIDHTSSKSKGKKHQRSKTVHIADVPEITVSVEPEPHVSPPHALQPFPVPEPQPFLRFEDTQQESLAPFPVPERGAELSVIAEGDESPERSRTNILPSSPSPPVDSDHDECPAEVEVQTCHAAVEGNLPVEQVNEYHAAVDSYHDLPSVSSPMIDEKDVHKSSTSGFPTLPAPSPLRKSMRVSQEAAPSAIIPSTTPAPAPAPAPLGKRTSWLMKAREAKAMEATTARPSTLGNMTTATAPSTMAAPPVSTAVKRKSGEMLGVLSYAPYQNGDQRKSKAARSTEADIAPLIGTAERELVPLNDDEGFIGQFKRTVEGFGARAGKSMGKSLGGTAAAAALTEARAAAEARVAERNKINPEVSYSGAPSGANIPPTRELSAILTQPEEDRPPVPTSKPKEAERRLSLSDLVPDTEKSRESQPATKVTQVPHSRNQPDRDRGDESISTTPPNSPPSQRNSSFVKPAGPVFNKQPVFMPPTSRQASAPSRDPKESVFSLPTSKFTLPVPMSLGVPARLTSPPSGIRPPDQGGSQVSVQSSQASLLSDAIFDRHDEVPEWMPSTQETSYTVDSQPHNADAKPVALDDDDDSWPLEEKLAAAEQGWRPFDFNNVDKEDTWSSLPTESQGPTRSLTGQKKTVQLTAVTAPQAHDMDVDVDKKEGNRQEQEAIEISDVDEGSVMGASDLEEVAKAGLFTINLVEKPTPVTRSNSQMSMTSTASSSQSQVGFFGQATKLVSSMLGGSKKAKPEVKSLQLAAAAAKKQQDEADRKTQRLKEMEARRQAALSRKAEEEKTRLLEEEKKMKEDGDKRKREREENTDKRSLRPPAIGTKKLEDDTTKKRKIASEVEKKQEAKKPPSKDKKDVVPSSKLAKPSLATPATKTVTTQKSAKATTTALVSSTAYNATQNAPSGASAAKPTIPEAKPFKVVPSSLKGKAKAKPQDDDMGDKLPSTLVQSQMAARAKAQMQAAKQQTPEVPSESIELPDIHSEYSDSEDEDRVRTFDPPDWAQSPELRQALQMQSTVNPDDIFGTIRPLRMEEIFRTRQSRFRARTSSANWSGSDRLTVEEIRDYERRMGFQPTRAS
ncbi:hypothetical protein BU15DRAFT_63233 [Melanogaster broomeanus]|nr:hypothetical protein BU15DRAFT_63233 [Melanogaster broomeanus]